MKKITVILVTCVLVWAELCQAERIKDIVDIGGVRSNSLSGVGLIMGLTKTGDSASPSRQMLTNILKQSGLVFKPAEMGQGSIAIVMVTAELGPFDRLGSRIDVLVSTIGDAASLQGGTLYPTPLTGLDGQVYAVAGGPVSLGGFGASGQAASVTVNHLTVGRIPAGATVEKEEIATFVDLIAGNRYITLGLRNNDFSTAQKIGDIINLLYPSSSIAEDAGTIRVKVPDDVNTAGIAQFISNITSLEVRVDMSAVVVINERTGTIVVGEKVGISTVAISQGSLVVKVKETENVSQPAPFSYRGNTEKTTDTSIDTVQEAGHLVPVQNVVTVADLANALNAIGVTPMDMIAIFNALKKAGALQARLEIM
jgi:flagellar P-ring protein precursor FlgI